MATNSNFLFQYRLLGDRSGELIVGGNAEVLTPSSDSICWQHINLEDEGAVRWLETSANLEPHVVQSLTAIETRPRSFPAKDGLMIVLRGVNTNPGQDSEDMVAIRVWIEKHRIISCRKRQLLSILDIVDSLNNKHGPRSPGEFLTQLIENLANRIGDFVNDIEDNMGEAEDGLEDLEGSDLRATLGALRRQIAVVRRFLAPQRDALDRLYLLETDILTNRDRQKLREESDRVSRYLEDLDLARERAVVLQEAFLSQLAQEQNSRMYVLSVVAAIFLPLTFVTGLLGMNVGGLPGLENPRGFLIATVVMIGATLGLIVLFKKKKWI